MKLQELFEDSDMQEPLGNWFNVKTGRQFMDHSGESPHSDAVIRNPAEFGYPDLNTDDIDFEDGLNDFDGNYATPYANGWVRWFFFEMSRELMCTSILENFKSTKGKMELKRLANLFSPTTLHISDTYNNDGTRDSRPTWQISLDVDQLKERGKFINKETNKPAF